MLLIPDLMPYVYCAIIALSASLAVSTSDARFLAPMPSAFCGVLALVSGVPFRYSAAAFFAVLFALITFYYAVSAILGRKNEIHHL